MVFAGPPFVTDDPEPVDYQHWEFYIASQDSQLGGDWSGTAPHFEINYGAAPDLQLHLIAPLGYDSPPTGAAHYGLADLEIGAKYRLCKKTTGCLGWGFFHANCPRAARTTRLAMAICRPSCGSGFKRAGGLGRSTVAVITASIPSVAIKIGAFSVPCEKQVLPNVLIGAEVFHQTVYQTDFPNVGTAFNIGMVINFNEHQHLLFSAGRSIDGPIGFQCYVAYQFTFGPEVFHSLSHWFGHQLTSHGQTSF